MLQRMGALAILVVALSSLGCAMCAAPDDYGGPVPASGLGFNDRAGSILQGNVPPNAVFDAEVSQEAIGESVTEGPPQQPSQGQPTEAPPLGPQSRRSDQGQWR
ncbi:MAG TPA: hypothetical protein VGG64_18760 [Pirellulales bacterium]